MFAMKYALSFCLFLTLASVGSAMRCYVCAGSQKSDCALFKPTSLVTQECNPLNKTTSSNQKKYIPQCIKFYETEHYNPKIYIRGCILVPESAKDGCSFISKYVTTESCVTCNTDLCNKGF